MHDHARGVDQSVETIEFPGEGRDRIVGGDVELHEVDALGQLLLALEPRGKDAEAAIGEETPDRQPDPGAASRDDGHRRSFPRQPLPLLSRPSRVPEPRAFRSHHQAPGGLLQARLSSD